MLVAEELDADWIHGALEFAPANEAYNNPLLGGMQVTGGSTSVRAAWQPLREGRRHARGMLVTAAAAEWDVPAGQCRTENGSCVAPDGRRVPLRRGGGRRRHGAGAARGR